MSRLPSLLAVVVLSLLAPAAAEARGVFVVGDSLAVGTEPHLAAELPGWHVRTSADIGRHAEDGAAVLGNARRLPRVIAVSLGTNDDPRSLDGFERAIEAVRAAAGPRRCVVWATVRRPPVGGVGYAAYNALLARTARTGPRFELVRWKQLVSRHRDWLAGDGVHVDAAGYRARAAAYAEQIRACRRSLA